MLSYYYSNQTFNKLKKTLLIQTETSRKGAKIMNTNLAYQEEIYDEMINGQIVLMSPSPMANHVHAAGPSSSMSWW